MALMLARILAVLGALAVAAGVGLYSLPAGIICAGVELVAGAYVIGYLGAQRGARK